MIMASTTLVHKCAMSKAANKLTEIVPVSGPSVFSVRHNSSTQVIFNQIQSKQALATTQAASEVNKMSHSLIINCTVTTSL